MTFDLLPLLLVLALAIEAACGYPQALIPRIGHPVIWLGGLIARFDRHFNRPTMPKRRRRLNGLAALVLLLAVAAVPAALVQVAVFRVLPPWLALAVLALAASTLLAQRSLYTHVAAVATALETGGLTAGRQAVSMIVGRNVSVLDEAGVARAAIESLAENFSDGVTAPAFWCAVGGLPGIAAYKAVNTADSMIGHKTERHLHFGWAAARFDDLVNLPASRLTALFIALAAGRGAGAAWRAVRRDARHHRSPNAGWPEAAMAGALGLRLNGPKRYGETLSDDHWMGDGRAEATAADIRRALTLYVRACMVQFSLAAGAAAILHLMT
ncbi:adenosylcobinamide-phosphate synthase CbiB [Zavarzinia compransoris]|uniref:Cobalamin biosynthesis protein CobD n=1 Tax=Zavarzinia compransoris TaxID=1264899 RepID=A0A317DYY1_9PROT|nr:adenosylcobinamide-phosphate synthase CbiB [Zavarzinia compransoris]PWR19622.1 cobalamin biosynthesis protein CobD [Zavarzinia compransoris]